ncbi:arylsulfotransferase family protein [Mesorhizobium caraganae]|uniref:arylsulfotransferase family protein n=1 Tax=Mesorhizobium caraganae TaxID=483206 RepID=UPI003ECE20E0
MLRLASLKKYGILVVVLALGVSIGIDIRNVPWAFGRVSSWLTGEAAAPEASAGASDEPARGLWNRFRPPDGGSIDPAAVQKLKSIGYLSGYSAAKRYENVTLYDPSASFNAPSLYTSGHAPEAFLIDMNGKVLHQWRYEYDRALPGHLGPSTPSGTQHWRFASVMPNGDLLAIFEGQGLIRLDRESKLLWSLPIGAHHRLAIAANGDIYVLTREIRQIDGVNSVDPILEDFITVVSPDGKVKSSISLLSAFANSSYRPVLDRMPPSGDLFHTNALQILDGSGSERNPAFAAGNILVSLPLLDAIAIVDPARELVVWSLSGQWRFQHTPHLLPDGNILMFDNRGAVERSRILEINALSQQIVWTYDGGDMHPFFTEFNGASQRLPNGNTLVTESENGRAFEVTASGHVTWEFYNPHRAGSRGDLIATLFEVQRMASDFPLDWTKPEPKPEHKVVQPQAGQQN